MVIALVDGDGHVIRAAFLAAENFQRLADGVYASGMGIEPFPHHRGQKTRQRNAPGRAPPLAPLLLTDQDALGLEVEVGYPRPQYFRPSCPGMGREAEHR